MNISIAKIESDIFMGNNLIVHQRFGRTNIIFANY